MRILQSEKNLCNHPFNVRISFLNLAGRWLSVKPMNKCGIKLSILGAGCSFFDFLFLVPYIRQKCLVPLTFASILVLSPQKQEIAFSHIAILQMCETDVTTPTHKCFLSKIASIFLCASM